MGTITSIYNLFYYFVIYAMLGWVIEVIYAYFKRREFVNSGFLLGPFCPIYGVGIVSVFLILEGLISSIFKTGKISIIAVFLISTVIMSLVEGVTGFLMSSIFHITWWDYSEKPLNYKGYICLEFSLVWGVIGTVVLVWFHAVTIELVSAIPINIGEPLLVILAAYFLIDGTLTVRSLVDFKKLLLEFENVSEEHINSITKLIAEMQQVREHLAEGLKNGIERKSDELSNRLKHVQIQLKALQSNRHILSNSIKGSINELIDNDKILSLRTKFELKEIHNHYENLSNKISDSRLYRSFSGMKSINYRELLKELNEKRNNEKYSKK